VGIIGTRYHLDLQARELHELATGEPSRHLRDEGRVGGGGEE
jgi:hypothetical protein